MEGSYVHHQHSSVSIDTGDHRLPQWSIQETKVLLSIRAEMDQTFTETKRNKVLWGVIATKMGERGYSRSAEQCKCKWKNLVTRYKGCETMELDSMRQQFPFYNELHTIFAARMQRMLWIEGEGGQSGSKKKSIHLSSEDEDDDNEDSEGEKGGSRKKRKVLKSGTPGSSSAGSGNIINTLKEVLGEFMKQQMEMEMKWVRACEQREEARRVREMEWRERMVGLENERIVMERRWREREEQWRLREEARAERRDALVTTLLDKLRREEQQEVSQI